MIRVVVPGWRTLELTDLVLDMNGTLTLDGALLPGVAERLESLAAGLTVHLVTADTFGTGAENAARVGAHLRKLTPGDEAGQKLEYVVQLGPAQTVAIGNGANDARMLEAAGLGIAVVGPEGLATAALLASHITVRAIEDALDMLQVPQRLVATLRR